MIIFHTVWKHLLAPFMDGSICGSAEDRTHPCEQMCLFLDDYLRLSIEMYLCVYLCVCVYIKEEMTPSLSRCRKLNESGWKIYSWCDLHLWMPPAGVAHCIWFSGKGLRELPCCICGTSFWMLRIWSVKSHHIILSRGLSFKSWEFYYIFLYGRLDFFYCFLQDVFLLNRGAFSIQSGTFQLLTLVKLWLDG